MTRQEAIKMLNRLLLYCDECPHGDCEKCVEAINMAEDALEQVCGNDCEHCEWVTCPKMEREPTAEYSSDVISRQAAIDVLDTGLWGVEWDKALATVMLKDLPSAEKKRGKWLNYLKEGLKWKCSECGSKYTTPWHYCPNCGARMELKT